MKTREEYIASIYSKRDLLVKKRKKAIKTAVSSSAVIICLGASAFAMHGITNNHPEITGDSVLSDPAVTVSQANSTKKENEYVTENNVHFPEEGHSEKRTEEYTKKVHPEETTKKVPSSAEILPDASPSVSTTVRPEREEAGASEETKKDDPILDGIISSLGGGFTSSSIGDPEYPADTGGDDLPDEEEIFEAAFGYLTNEEQEKTDKKKTVSTITRNADGSSYYTVYFYVDGKTVTVKIDAESLAMIEKSETDTTNAEVSLPFVSSTTPGYNPDN